MDRYDVAIFGATGRTGASLYAILQRHPKVKVVARTSRGEPGYDTLNIDNREQLHSILSRKPQAGFICTKDEEAKVYVDVLLENAPDMKIIDLSSAHRLNYKEKSKKAAYGCPELPGNRDIIREADFVTNPGCYPTGVYAAILPLMADRCIRANIYELIICSTESCTGAGKITETDNWYNSNIGVYERPEGTNVHKHTDEMKHVLEKFFEWRKPLEFLPKVVDAPPGMVTDVVALYHADPEIGRIKQERLYELYAKYYSSEPFVRVVKPQNRKQQLSAKDVEGTNLVEVFATFNDLTENIVVTTAADNLIKGASGQAVQNMNLMFGLPETMGLEGKLVRYERFVTEKGGVGYRPLPVA